MLIITDNIYKLELTFGIRSHDLEFTAIDLKYYLNFKVFRVCLGKMNISYMYHKCLQCR